MATTKRLTVIRLDEPDLELLNVLAKRAGESQTGFIRRLVRTEAINAGLTPNIYTTAMNAPTQPASTPTAPIGEAGQTGQEQGETIGFTVTDSDAEALRTRMASFLRDPQAPENAQIRQDFAKHLEENEGGRELLREARETTD
jgi:hypothetical protein